MLDQSVKYNNTDGEPYDIGGQGVEDSDASNSEEGKAFIIMFGT